MTAKECVGRHIYTILSAVLLCLAFPLLFAASRDGIGSAPITVIAITGGILVVCSALVGGKFAYRRWSPEVIFHMFMGGYVIFRLPGLVYHRGTFFAFCEARKGIEDCNYADIVMRKGQLHGSKVKWGPLQLVAHDDNYRCANPVPLIDKETNTIMVLFILLVPGASCADFINKKHEQKIHIVKSTDWGETWTREDITHSIMGNTEASFYATGPCHGIQLRSGRLVVPGKFNLKAETTQKACRHGTCDHSMVIFSDDHGSSWKPGGFVPYKEDPVGRAIHTCEATILELQDNELCMNSRTLHPEHPRAQSFSYDGGVKFSHPELPENLMEQAYNECGYVNPERGGAPGCQGSMLGFPAPQTKSSSGSTHTAPLLQTHQTWALFSNPATRFGRFKMGVRLSKDGCQTWSQPWTIWQMASGYSDMALCISNDKDGREEMVQMVDGKVATKTVDRDQLKFAILFESGLFMFWETVVFKMFDVDEVMRKTN